MPTKIKKLMMAVIVLIMNTANIASAETLTYTYDSMQRITRVQYASGPVIEYVYDNMGNRLVRSLYTAGAPANSAPSPATQPSPANGAGGVSGPLTLSWTGSDPNQGDRLSYFVHAGTNANTLQPVWSGSSTSFKPLNLLANTTYYWKVVTRDSHNLETPGPAWSFTTGNAIVNALPVNLDVFLAGTGSGTVTGINPTGISCTGALSGDCAQDLALNTSVTLSAVGSNASRFEGWSVASCAAVPNYTTPPFLPIHPTSCTFTMTGDTTVTATFNSIPPIRILLPDNPFYPPFEMDIFATASGIVQSFGTYLPYSLILQSHDKVFIEDVNIDSGLQQVLWQGGYSGDYSTVTGTTRLQGILTVQGGRLVVERIVIE